MAGNGWLARKAARKVARKTADAVPDGLWTKCPKCNEILFTKELERNFRVCNKCGYHYKLGAMDRVAMTVDEGTFQEFADDLRSSDPLDFPEYAAKLEKGKDASGLEEAMVVGTAEVEGIPIALGVADFGFIGGSMGSVYGEKMVRATEKALEEKLPLVMFCSSGGARMHEGLLALMQMAKTGAAVARLDAEGLPYITILVDPCTAGVHASFASLGDVVIAEPGALIGFTGERVAQQAGVVHRPPNFQRAEFQLENGMVDIVVPRKEMKATLAKILQFCRKEAGNAA